jgi:hypothetical protein
MSSGSEYIQLRKKICTVQAKDGEKGEPGEKGENGINGIDGFIGSDGVDGLDGKNGYFGCWGSDDFEIDNGDTYIDDIGNLHENTRDIIINGIIRTNAHYKLNLTIDLDIYTSPEDNLDQYIIYWNSSDTVDSDLIIKRDEFLDIINKWNLYKFSFEHNTDSADVNSFIIDSYDQISLFMDYQEIITNVSTENSNLVLEKSKSARISISDVLFIPNDVSYDGSGNVILIPSIKLRLVFHSANPKMNCKISCSLTMITSVDTDYDFSNGYISYIPIENETNVATEEEEVVT